MKSWLRYLADKVGILEIFLVPSIVRFVEIHLRDRLLKSEEHQKKRQAFEESIMEAIEDPAKRKKYFEQPQKGRFSTSLPQSEKEQVEYLTKLLQHHKAMKFESAEQMRDKYRTWLDVSRYIGSDENIQKFLDEKIKSYLEDAEQ